MARVNEGEDFFRARLRRRERGVDFEVVRLMAVDVRELRGSHARFSIRPRALPSLDHLERTAHADEMDAAIRQRRPRGFVPLRQDQQVIDDNAKRTGGEVCEGVVKIFHSLGVTRPAFSGIGHRFPQEHVDECVERRMQQGNSRLPLQSAGQAGLARARGAVEKDDVGCQWSRDSEAGPRLALPLAFSQNLPNLLRSQVWFHPASTTRPRSRPSAMN